MTAKKSTKGNTPTKPPAKSWKQLTGKTALADRALSVLIDNNPAQHEESPWALAEAVEIGIQANGGFSPLDTMIILAIAGDYRRRLSHLERREFCDAVYAIRLVMYRRLKNDFPDCRVSMQIIQPNGDIGVLVENSPLPYVNDRHNLQSRLDDACRRVADCLGV